MRCTPDPVRHADRSPVHRRHGLCALVVMAVAREHRVHVDVGKSGTRFDRAGCELELVADELYGGRCIATMRHLSLWLEAKRSSFAVRGDAGGHIGTASSGAAVDRSHQDRGAVLCADCEGRWKLSSDASERRRSCGPESRRSFGRWHARRWKRAAGIDVRPGVAERECSAGNRHTDGGSAAPDGFEMDVTGCVYAQFFQQLGEPELGFLLMCSADFDMADELPDRPCGHRLSRWSGLSGSDLRGRCRRGGRPRSVDHGGPSRSRTLIPEPGPDRRRLRERRGLPRRSSRCRAVRNARLVHGGSLRRGLCVVLA